MMARVHIPDVEIPGLRHRVKTNLTTVQMEADRYGVGVESIRRAVRGDTYRHIREGLGTTTHIEKERLEAEAEESLRRLQSGEIPPPPEGVAPGTNGDPVEDFLTARRSGEKDKK